MRSNTERTRTLLVISTIFQVSLTACFEGDTDTTSGQRRVSESEVEGRDLSVQVASGAIRSVESGLLRARASAPAARVTLSTGHLASGPFDLLITNLHPTSSPFPLAIQEVGTDTNANCPDGDAYVLCDEATRSVGLPCASSEDCASGTTCIASVCERLPILDSCDPLSVATVPDTPKAFRVSLDLQPCRNTTLEFRPQDPTPSTTFAVVGSTSSLNRMDAALNDAESRGAEFVVLLGENLESANEAALESMQSRLDSASLPVVFVASPNANKIEEGQVALRRLGPHDFSFNWNGSAFVVFFSAAHAMEEAGLNRLETFLRPLRRTATSPRPLFAFTHTPPIDPNGIRNLGFKHRSQGARVISLLNGFGVSALFSGRIRASDEADFGELTLYISSASDSVLNEQREYMLVRASQDGSYEAERITF